MHCGHKKKMEEVKRMLTMVEDIIRGRPIDEQKLNINCKEFFHWSSVKNMDAFMSLETKSEIFKNTINLHNKLRVLPNHVLEAKAYLKGSLLNYTNKIVYILFLYFALCLVLTKQPPHGTLFNLSYGTSSTGACAWLILRTGDLKAASVCPYVKVFYRASQELMSMDVDGKVAALSCINQTLECWNDITSPVFERSLSPIDFEQMKIMIAQALIDKIKLLNTLKSDEYLKSMRQSVGAAVEVILWIAPSTTRGSAY